MKRAIVAGALAALLGTSALVQVHPAPALAQVHPAAATVPIVLPHPPPITNATSSILFNAMLAIARAQQIDPQAAQTASFQYVQAVQQYRTGNISGANAGALRALSTASQAQVQINAPAPLPPPALVPATAPASGLGGLAGGLYGAGAPAIDADSFLALARGIIDDCAARHDRRLAGAKQHYAQAERDFSAHDWQATRIDAKAAIDACAKPQP